MPNTTNYSFPTPADTDLVKNGADAIRDLGDAVDTAMNTALGTKKAGMVLLNTTSFSGVATQSVDNVFTSAYENYRVLIRYTDTSAGANLNIRFRVGGVDASGATTYKYVEQDSTTTVTALRGNGNQGVIGNSANTSTQLNTSTLDIFSPALATATAWSCFALSNTSSGLMRITAGNHAVATAYDGFTIISTGTISGKVYVYGYNF
jgi:hypothetical protein